MIITISCMEGVYYNKHQARSFISTLFSFTLFCSLLLEQDMIITISCMEGVYYNIILSLESSGYDTITIKVKEITIKIKDLA